MEEVISNIRELLGLDYNCSLQYKDPDFDYELCNPSAIADLPEKPTIKVIPVLELVPVSASAQYRGYRDNLTIIPGATNTVARAI